MGTVDDLFRPSGTKLQSRPAPSSCASPPSADMGTSTSRANWARPRRAGPWRFVRLGRESGKVAEVDEFEVASALFAGERDALSQLTEGRHLFNLCLEFGLDSTALALLEHGVEGCRLEWDDLKGLSSETWSWGSWKGCRCPYGSWQSCSACSWGFPLETWPWNLQPFRFLRDHTNL